MKNYFANWQKTTSDPYIFNIKRGYQIDFYTFSSQSNPPNPIKFSDDEKRAGFLQWNKQSLLPRYLSKKTTQRDSALF